LDILEAKYAKVQVASLNQYRKQNLKRRMTNKIYNISKIELEANLLQNTRKQNPRILEVTTEKLLSKFKP